jgi:UDP-glucose 4-epimerase
MAVAWFFMETDKKKILITGGAGYIGSHTAKELYLSGYIPYVLDNFSTGHDWAVKWGDSYNIDLSDKIKLLNILNEIKPEAVIHFAASSLVSESYNNPISYFNNNIIGTMNLLESMHELGIDKLIFSSSCSVYGIPNTIPISDDHPLNPISPYGESKSMIEKILRWYSDLNNLKYMSLRYFNAAGADPDNDIGEAHDPETHLIPLAINVALGIREYLNIYGVDYPTDDGTAVRDYIHVKDLALAHVSALDYLLKGGHSHSLNLGTGKGYSVNQIISEINKISKNKILSYNKERRLGDPSILIADNQKAIKILNWKPIYSDLHNIVKTAYEWQKKTKGCI